MVNTPVNTAPNRRTVLRSLGALAVGGALAGCSSDGGDGGGDGDGDGGGDGGGDGDGDGGSDGGGSVPSPDTTVTGGGVSASEAEDYASASSNFDGVVDRTGQDSVEVVVGAEGNDGNFAFDPPAVKVSEGTTVVWRWNGQGGTHNVIADSGEFDSGSAVEEEGTTYVVTFDATGAWGYFCSPHEALGMKGAVIVE